MTRERRHEWVEARLSDHLDGVLSDADRREVARHLEVCEECRATRAELAAVSGAARALGALEPPRDLWPGIADAIEVGAEPAHEATPFSTARIRGGRVAGGSAPAVPRGSVRRSRPALAAAAVVLVAVSASLAWWARGAAGGALPFADATTAPESAVRPTGTGPVPASAELAQELERLKSVLGGARDRLDPNTVSVLERNLVLIERAIEDSYRALALDPENEFVRDHLERTFQRKAEFLRQVSRIAEIAG